jgi:hypothetical protein
MDGNPGLQRPGLTVTNVFRGEFQPHPANGHCWPDGSGDRTGHQRCLGRRAARHADAQRHTHRESDPRTRWFGSATPGGGEQRRFHRHHLARTLSQPQTGFYIQQVLDTVQKNVDGETLGQNLKAYKDHVVLFGQLTGDGLQNVQVNWTINDDRTYQAFICKNAEGDHDGDANTNITVDRDRLDLGSDFIQPYFWSQGWERWVNPQVVLAKLT